jgi:hypothetical protein
VLKQEASERLKRLSGFTVHTLHIALRKRKFMDAACQFMVFNYSLTHAALVGLKTVLRSPILQISNATVPAGERFYDVPVSEAVIINMLV